MGTFTLTVTTVSTDLRQTAPRITEALRKCADDLVQQTGLNQSSAPTPVTKTDWNGFTVYSYTIA